MIVAPAGRAEVLLGHGTERIRIHCLARRGMLHSECEAFDRVGLSPGARFALVGREGTEAAWYVVRGTAALSAGGSDNRPQRLGEGSLVLAPRGEDVELEAGRYGAELLCLTTVPPAVTAALPPRTPDTVAEARPAPAPGPAPGPAAVRPGPAVRLRPSTDAPAAPAGAARSRPPARPAPATTPGRGRRRRAPAAPAAPPRPPRPASPSRRPSGLRKTIGRHN
ncbi:hypothetical protein, partial [Streptomyces capparidis]